MRGFVERIFSCAVESLRFDHLGSYSLSIVLIFSFHLTAAAQPLKLQFKCPRAYQGIKSEFLPTYWEAADRGKSIDARQSHVQGKYMICIYRESNGRPIGNVRRLIPRGYHCITDGRGVFQCRRRDITR